MKRSDISTLDVLLAVAAHEDIRKDSEIGSAITFLSQRVHAPGKLALRALEREESAGYLDCGTSLNYPWLTAKGTAAMLRLLEPTVVDAVKRRDGEAWVIDCTLSSGQTAGVVQVYGVFDRLAEEITDFLNAPELMKRKRLLELLKGRDAFIVSKGLWSEFTETLP